MGTIANLLVKVGVDVRDADRDLSRFSSKTGRGLRRSLVPAIGVLTGIGLAAKAGFSEFVTAEKVTAQTNAVLKSTGNAANTSVSGIQSLSGALMRKSGVDDEVIQSGANMLLTFTNIRNEVGKGNNIFDQATTTALDMSVALGQDMKSSTIQLGKALNDPIKGVTALQRVGVSFSKGQRDQIKAMVESGNTMGAQKLILRELTKEFGGSAQAAGSTLTGQLNIAKQTFLNLAGSIVGALLPAFNMFAGALGTVANWMARHETATKVIVGVIGGLAAAVVVANVALKLHAAATVAATVASKAASAAARVWAAGQWLLNAALSANPIGLIVIAVAALVAGIVLAWKHSETFRDIVTGAFNVVWGAIKAVWDWVSNNWPLLLAILTGPIGLAVKFIVDNWNGIVTFFTGIPGRIWGALSGMWTTVKSTTSTAVEFLQKVWDGFVAFLTGIPGRIWGALSGAWTLIKSAADTAVGFITGLWDGAIIFLRGIPERIFNALSGAWEFFKNAVGTVVDKIESIPGAVGKVKDYAWGKLEATIVPIWNAIRDAVSAVADKINAVISAAKTAVSWIGKVIDKAGDIGGGILSKIPGLATGGIVTRPTLAMVGEAGPEAVVPLSNPRRAAEVMDQAGLAGGGGGPTVHIDTMVVQDATDIDRVASRLGRQLIMAG